MSDTPQVLLAHHLKTLKLPTFLREYDKLARQCASEDRSRAAVRSLQPALRAGLDPGDLQLAFDEWTEIFGSERLTGALLDRLTHHVHILEMNGESYRLNQSQKRRKSPNTPA